VVGSSAKTSSKRVQEEVAASIEAVGVVTVSPGECQQGAGTEYRGVNEKEDVLLKSKAAAPGASQALLRAESNSSSPVDSWPLMPFAFGCSSF